MRKYAAILLSLLICGLELAAQVDTAKVRELDSRLERYFSLLEAEPVEVKKAECDALIEAASDKDLRQRIALKAYNHYLNSTLMGDEAVAIHLTDKWFSNGKIPMGSEKDLLDAKLFAEFNRQSLIGMTAPEVTLVDSSSAHVTFPGSGRFQVLYFYDTDCAKCKLESPMLRSLLDDKDCPVDVFAVYVGRDENKWTLWRKSTFKVKAPSVRVTHLWDPDDESDYQMKYGVTSTPKMFLVDPDGIIVGRNLDTDSLEKLMDASLAALFYDYGGEEALTFFEKLFSTYGSKVSPENVTEIASMLESRTLARGDTLSFKHLEGDLLYYLAGKREEGFKEGTYSFIKDYILARPDVWNNADDSLKVVGLASMLDGLLSKAPVGTRIPKTGIKGWNKTRRKGGLFLFSTTGCPVCAAEQEAADSLHLKYLKVDMTSLEKESPRTARKLLDFFDLSSLPHIIQTGRRGVIERRYVSLVEHLLFLDEKD